MPIRVVELFAGVGGFRLGLERASPKFRTVWWNQWEPKSVRQQHAWHCYASHFSAGETPHSNADICGVSLDAIPEHDLLVGGFPCQDYSVATTLDKSGGLRGKKGVLWWQIERIAEARRPRYMLLENVDRLLKSPAQQRGRDFGVVLACLARLGYIVEWRVLNAADYGCPQRRRRVFIFAAREDTRFGKYMAREAAQSRYLYQTGFFAPPFPVSFDVLPTITTSPQVRLDMDPRQVSKGFAFPFQNAGVMVAGSVWTAPLTARAEPQATLGNVLEAAPVDASYFLDESRVADWEYQKGSKREKRQARNGHEYYYTEGGMQFPDLGGVPARTVLTSEANRTPNRSTHVVQDRTNGKLRFLTPEEVERLMGFPTGWTGGLPPRWRYFTMGNALVVPLVTRMGERLQDVATKRNRAGTGRKISETKVNSGLANGHR